ncbi:MAG TPA: glycosyltransferase [Chloroflexia bacterium]|nr:glycosyltransferase [Chloroflexia bacterium]
MPAIAVYDNLTSGGSKRELSEFVRQLAEAGMTVDLYTTTVAAREFLSPAAWVRHTYVYPFPAMRPMARRLPGLRKHVEAARELAEIAGVRRRSRRIAADIDRRAYDWVFVHHCRPVQSPFLLGFLRTGSVYYCAEPMREFYEPAPPQRPYEQAGSRAARLQAAWYSPTRRLVQGVIRAADRRNVRHATLLLANSRYSVASLRRAYGVRAQVCYLGVDTGKFRPLGAPRQDYVLAVGAVAPLKGYDFLVRAVGAIPVAMRPPLVLIGNTVSGAEAAFLQDLAMRHGVKLTIRGNVDESELVEAYNAARVFVYAAHREPFGLAPVEAMACGTPVVAVAEGGPRESVLDGETGYLVPREEAVFAGRVQQLLTNPARGQALGEQGRRHVLAHWTWPQAAARLQQLVSTAIHS